MITSARSKRSNPDPARPFAKTILNRARQVAAGYKIVVDCENGHWFGHGLEMPMVFGDGKSVRAAVDDTREALITAVAYLLEQGRTPPPPAREGNRSVQVNVRLTVEEKALLETRAKAKGFRGLSDFIRAQVLVE